MGPSGPPQVVSLALVDEPRHQLRETIDSEALGELADDIAVNGLLQPVGLRGPDDSARYEIIWGHRRFLAMQSLGRTELPAIVYPPGTEPLLLAVSENLQRRDLTPVEEARVVKRLLDAGQPASGVARLLRRSLHWVGQRAALLAIPDDVQAAVADGVVKLGCALALGDVDHDDYRRSLIAECARTGATVQTVQLWVAHYQADRDRIISNRMVVAEIASRREAWKYYVPCDGCGLDREYTDTTGLRFCSGCLDEIAGTLAERAARLAAGVGPATA
jgi:ParB family chromosome partitioning protein